MRALIRFGKQPRLRFISHLDIQRFFQRALNRTGLPIAFSQGFNPHPVMSFASALALNWTSEYEILDVKLTEPVCANHVEAVVRDALPGDLPVLEVRMVEDRFPSLMSKVYASEYRIEIGKEAAPALHVAAEEFLRRSSYMAVRKTKSGERQVDIRPLLLSLDPLDNGFQARLMLTEQNTLKPDLFVRALSDLACTDTPPMTIHRIALLGQGDSGQMKPLMEL